MATYVEGTGVTREAEPIGLLTEGAAGMAVIVLSIISLAGISPAALAPITTIVIGVGLMAQGFNTAAEKSRVLPSAEWGSEVMVDCLTGGVGIVLGILALIGTNAMYLMSTGLIVFGAALVLSGALAMQTRAAPIAAGPGAGIVSMRGSAATGGMEILIGLAAVVLGILSLVLLHGAVLLLVGFIAVGAGLLMVSATFGGAVLRIFTATAE
jgi:hypothetical protein